MSAVEVIKVTTQLIYKGFDKRNWKEKSANQNQGESLHIYLRDFFHHSYKLRD